MQISDEVKAIIVEVLCGQALADHLGDIRDEEQKLWKLLGIKPEQDGFTAWENTCHTLIKNNIPFPSYLDDKENESV